MDAVSLRHVNKSYTSYTTEVVLSGQTRESRTRQVLRDLSVTFPVGGAERHRRAQRVRKKYAPEASGRAGAAGFRRAVHAGGLAQRHAQPGSVRHHMDERAEERCHGLRRRQDAGGAV